MPLPPLALIGRSAEMQRLHDLLDRAEGGKGGTLILCGESGVGKSRLLRTVADEAEKRGWLVATGRAYPVETGVPYAPLADALLPRVRQLSPEALSTLTRGGEAELYHLFPALRPAGADPRREVEDPAELKTRLLWSFAQFLGRLAARQPLLILLDDLQWADASSLELLHFVARQISGERIALLCSYNEAQRDQNPRLRQTEQSLVAMDAARVHRVSPLSHADTARLIQETFDADEATTREFAALLFGWTRGNPFFLEEVLKSLVASGHLHQREGTWLGWEVEEIQLPRTIRDAVLERLSALDAGTRKVAEMLAVIGTSTRHAVLRAVSGLPEAELVGAVDELRRLHVIQERLDGDAVLYDFVHPVLRETLYGELGLARARLLHAHVAEKLEECYGSGATARADELAYHFARAHAPEMAPKAVRYLAAAGRNALAKYSNREAADYLSSAVELAAAGEEASAELLEDLARARQRLGEFDAAIALWQRLRDGAAGDPARLASVERRLGLALYFSGQRLEALEHFDAGLDHARHPGAEPLRARLHLARGECLQDVGRSAEALEELRAALEIAEELGEAALLARVHLALLLLHTWMGPPEQARAHGERALAFAARTGEQGLSCTLHWALAVLAGFTGDVPETARHIRECERLADELRSPLHRLRIAEVAIEFMANTGEWDAAAALAERTLAAARALNQRALLARLLVWTAILYFGRGDLERGKAYVDEAWELSRADAPDAPLDVHSAVPAHCGRAAYHVMVGEYDEAIRVGERGLAIADRTGYTVWAVHRLLPFIAEAYVARRDLEGASRVGERLRRDTERLGHQLGLAWADACEGFVMWLRGDLARGIAHLRQTAERLEAIPAIPDAARLRRHIAALLRNHGEREEALRELRHIHDVFVRLGAEPELQTTRRLIRELGARPPVKEAGAGVGGLSAREVEIARMVAERKSNKTIARALDISPRTVSTHLSNIFRKLEVDSRAELADRIRAGGLSG